MTAYSICLIAVMIVNFGLMIYKRGVLRTIFVLSVVIYGIFIFAKDLSYNEYPFFGYLLALVCLSLFLYKKYGSQCFGTIFFTLPWVTLTRALGFPDNPHFGKKG